MRCLAILAVWLAGVLLATAAPIRVVTWNCKWFPGGKPNATEAAKVAHMAKAQAVVKELDPDVLLLQEVRDWKSVQELCSVVPGLHVVVVSQFPGWPQNVAIASKLPMDSAWYATWTAKKGERSPPRGYAFAAFRLSPKVLLLTYSVHMKSNVGEPEKNVASRNEATRQLLTHAKAMVPLYSKRAGISIVVGGDFNSDLDSSRYKDDDGLKSLRAAGLRWAWERIPLEQRLTVPAYGKYPADCFDHILYGGLLLKGATVESSDGASDHNPVLAILSL